MNPEHETPIEENEGVITETPSTDKKESDPRWSTLWDRLVVLGVGETVQRVGSAILLVVLVVLIVWVLGRFYLPQPEDVPAIDAPQAERAAVDSVEAEPVTVELPSLEDPFQYGIYTNGVTRLTRLHTDLPSKPRWEVANYIVKEGDTIFDIAEKFNLNPETVMWANYYILGDNPHALSPDQVLNILPVDGTYYEWHAGDGLTGVADFYGVTPEDIINWPGNNLTAENVGDLGDPNIDPGTWLIIPGGTRDYISWSAPLITREDPAQASIFGPGACGAVYDGPIGDGVMIWPTIERWLSGYDYSPATNHYGIDIAGDLGFAIWSVDDGVVVYSGWNNWGYGNVVVIDHGNGWQSLYAHLDYINYDCGAYVYEGDIIGGMGSTGKSSGPHLHFELRSDTYGRPNPKNFLN
ncbi:MAG: M23 family metallopeptidase [Anaerolineaceae bacterium]|nr:M23 family metallopeptidase [Anaerolineaceae bacterium]